MLKLYKDPKSGMIPWPAEWAADIRYNGGTNTPCDMLIGPCACGAWHTEEEGWVKNLLIKQGAIIMDALTLLDDYPEFDYETILKKYGVKVTWDDKLVDSDGNERDAPPSLCGWGFSDEHGYIFVGRVTEVIARKAAAIWTALWYRRVSASLCCRLMEGYIGHLEAQESTRITFLAQFGVDENGHLDMNLTRERVCVSEGIVSALEIIQSKLGPVAEDEEIICTFTKRKVI